MTPRSQFFPDMSSPLHTRTVTTLIVMKRMLKATGLHPLAMAFLTDEKPSEVSLEDYVVCKTITLKEIHLLIHVGGMRSSQKSSQGYTLRLRERT